MIHLENKSKFFFTSLENAVNSVFITCAGLTPWQTSSTVCKRTSLHVELPAPLDSAFGVILWGSTAAPHGLLFGTRALTTQRPCNRSTMTHCNLDQKLPALTVISWQCGCQFHVPVTSNPCCASTSTLHYFLFVFPLCFWPLLLLSLYPSLSQESWIALFIYHCCFKRHPQLEDERETEG